MYLLSQTRSCKMKKASSNERCSGPAIGGPLSLRVQPAAPAAG